MFKKSNRKFKQRSKIDSDEEDDVASSFTRKEDQEDKNLETTIKPPAELNQKNVKLSFADDEGDSEEIKLKRSSSSLKAYRQLGKKAREAKRSKQNELINQANQTNQTKSVRKMMETTKLENVEETNEQPRIINLEDEDEIETIEMEDDYLMFKKPNAKADRIPDNKTIELLKRQRFLAKEQSEYISISSPPSSTNEYQSKYESVSNSRLVREDPDDREIIPIDDDNGDLDDGRVDFYSSDKLSKTKEKIKEAFFNAQSEEHSNDNRFKFDDKSSDDELDLWEKSQIKKGVGFQQQKELNTNDFGSLLNDQRNPAKEFDPPAFIKSIRPPLDKTKLINKYKEELYLIERKLDYLNNQFNNIETTISNLKETLQVDI